MNRRSNRPEHVSCKQLYVPSSLQDLSSKAMDFLEEELEIVWVDEWCYPCMYLSDRESNMTCELRDTYRVQD